VKARLGTNDLYDLRVLSKVLVVAKNGGKGPTPV
jgi:hypothetical protein